MSAPWTFEQAQEHLREASTYQREVEDEVKAAFRAYGEAERAYRRALAVKLVQLRAAGHAATLCQDLAKGDAEISDLRLARDVAEGNKEAAMQSGWRRSSDRKDAQRFAAWSQARELAEHGQPDEWLSWTPKAVA